MHKALIAACVLAAALAVAGGSASGRAQKTNLTVTADKGGKLKFNVKSLSAKKGVVTIVMMNPKGSGLSHGIGVNGNGVDKDGKTVAPGKTTSVTVTLKKAGKYTFYCPVKGHEKAGMKGTLTVK
jgi:uncharacterized cupredoxin-like copper-binding protein